MTNLPTPKSPVRVKVTCKKCGHTETFIGPNRDEVECNIAYSDWVPVVSKQGAYYLCAKCDKGSRFQWRPEQVVIIDKGTAEATMSDEGNDKTLDFYRDISTSK
jgi:RNase P subunit RPR2